MKCRFCENELKNEFVDLVTSPPSNSFLLPEQLNQPETYYPLKLYVCEKCLLVQIDEYKQNDDIFNNEYVYFSSYSKSWLAHCKNYVNMMTNDYSLNKDSLVVEIASNDGYLLQYFKEKQIPSLGIEPSTSTAKIAIEKGIDTITEFFNSILAEQLVKDGKSADLILGNNVLAHDPNLNDLVKGMKIALKENGIITMEFPHLMQLIENNQFDTIYHEHFSYFSFTTIVKIFKKHGLAIFNVDEIPTHGGSLRIYAKHFNNTTHTLTKKVQNLLIKESSIGMNNIDFYHNFKSKVNFVKNDFLGFLIEQKKKNKKVVAYGAAAKGNTLLNYCGVKDDFIEFVVDLSPHKQNKYLPGSRIPVKDENEISKFKPDYIIILPWNIKDEIVEQLSYVSEWGCEFVVAIPELKIF
jgi:SAM-dependent methyltransferase